MGWKEVSDYYEELPARSQNRASSSTPCVLEAASRKVRFSRDWSNAEALRELVTRNAVNARVSEWETKGTRVVDPWPVVFDYNTRENRWGPHLWLKLFTVFVVYIVVQPALKLVAEAALLGWGMALGITGLYLLVVGASSLMFLIPLAQYQGTGRRKAERITADVTGIVFESKTRRVQAAWQDVTCCRALEESHGLLCRFVVETREGEFDFLSSIGNAGLLRAIIRRFAAGAENSEWRLPADHEALGGEAARWTGGKAGVGSRFFHYRTRGYRAVLLGMAFLGLVCGLLFIGTALGWLPGTVVPGGVAASGVVWSAGLVLGWRAYRRNGIALDDSGLTQRTLFGSRYLAWEQVQEYAVTPLGGGKVSGRGVPIGFSSEIVGYQELKEEINLHAADLTREKAKWESVSP